MSILYKEIQNAKNAFSNGEISYFLINDADYKLVFIFDELVTVVIQLDDVTITYDELFSLSADTNEIYKAVSKRLNSLNNNLSYLFLDLI